MSVQQPEPGGNKPPKVQPEVSLWDIREVKGSWWAKAILTATGVALPLGVIAAMCYVVREILRADGIESGLKVVGAIAVVLTLVILGMAMLLKGAKTHAETTKDDSDESADS